MATPPNRPQDFPRQEPRSRPSLIIAGKSQERHGRRVRGIAREWSRLSHILIVRAFSVKCAALIRTFLFASFRIYCVVQIDVHGNTLVHVFVYTQTQQTHPYTALSGARVIVPTGERRFYFRKKFSWRIICLARHVRYVSGNVRARSDRIHVAVTLYFANVRVLAALPR